MPPLSLYLGYENEGGIDGGIYTIAVVLTFVGLSFGCVVSIIYVAADACRAFKQRKHWIPGDSLVLGALALQLLMLLNKPSLEFSFNNRSIHSPLRNGCEYLNVIHGEWVLILIGRVSTCVLMGCLLPGVATPLSTTLRPDMAALFISFALVSVYVISHELFILPSASTISGYVIVSNTIYSEDKNKFFKCPPTDLWNSIFMEFINVIVLVCMVTLALLLGCAALASIGIHEIVVRKIHLLLPGSRLSSNLYPPKILWEKIQEQVVKSWIAVRTSNPQYIIARSILSSSVALIITVCNVALVFEIARCSYKTTLFTTLFPSSEYFYLYVPEGVHNLNWTNWIDLDEAEGHHEGCVRPTISIPLILHYTVIFLGSAVIYCRCVTAAVYYPRGMRWKLFNVREYWQVEDFWVSHLVDMIESSKRRRCGGIGGERHLTKLIARLSTSLGMHKLLPLFLWLQIILVFFCKLCWLSSQLLFSNQFFRKLLKVSASEGETQLERDPEYKKVCVTMQGENAAGIWIANKASIQELKRRFGKGEEEGKRCNELIELLKNKSSVGFRGQRCVKPGCPLGLEVESELNVRQSSFMMTTVSILTLIFELSQFVQNESDGRNMADRAMKACCQAWSIMNVVEYSDSEAAVLIKAADELLQKLRKERKWLDHHLPMSDSADKSHEAAIAAVKNMFERGKEVANEYNSRAWEEVAAAYSLCRQCRSIMNEYEFSSVEEVVDRLEGVLADVMGSCIAKAGQVIAEDCKKWATNLEEERIWKAAKVVGKVKAVTEKTGVILEVTPVGADIDQSAAGNLRHSFKCYEKFPTMTR